MYYDGDESRILQSCIDRSVRLTAGLEGQSSQGLNLSNVDLVDAPAGDEGRDGSTSRVMSNMLQDLSSKEAEGPIPKPKGIYIGDGLPPVPARVADKITKWEFIEMHEMLPEFWAQKTDEAGGKASTSSKARARKRVQDINVWLQCFALYVSVMSAKDPGYIPELMAYMVSILRASQEYEGTAWTTYDTAYRRQAAATGHKKWSQVNPSLYTVCFTGKARRATRCDLCLSSAHKTEECHLWNDDDPDLAKRMRAVETAVVAFSSNSNVAKTSVTAEVCRLYNQRKCRFRNCKYTHICQRCSGNHPVIECPSTPKQGGNAGGVGPIRYKAAQHPTSATPY